MAVTQRPKALLCGTAAIAVIISTVSILNYYPTVTSIKPVYQIIEQHQNSSDNSDRSDNNDNRKSVKATDPSVRLPETNAQGLNERLLRGEPIVDLIPCPAEMGSNLKCQNYTPDWRDEEDIQSLLERRINRVRRICDHYYPYMFNLSLSSVYGRSESKPGRQGHTHCLVNERLNITFCWMPKMGSQFWLRAWPALNNAPSTLLEKPSPHQRYTLLLKNVFSNHTGKASGFGTVYTIARSPWQRIVSVYREKCESQVNNKCRLLFGRGCWHVRTFTVFVQCILGEFEHDRTEYWGHVDMTYERNGVCDYPFNYVVLMENMTKEKEYLFKKAGVIDPLKTMDRVRKRTIRLVEKTNQNLTFVNYWKTVPEHLIDRVRFFYRYELYLYSYPETPFYISTD